jgi:hypothetical protein
MSINLRTFFKLVVLIGLSTTLIMLLSFADLSAVGTNFHICARRSTVPINVDMGSSSTPWSAAIDHSRCPLDKPFKVYLYNHHHSQDFRQFLPINRQQSLLNVKTLELRLKRKQAWAASPEEACVFLVVLRPLLQISSHAQSERERENGIASFLSSLPYWTFHGSDGRNHIIVDLLESTAQAKQTVFGFVDAGDAIIVSNYVTSGTGILAPPLPQAAVSRMKWAPSSGQASASDTYANIERIFAAVNVSHEYSSILPLRRKYLFYFEGSFVESMAHIRLEADSQISMIQKQASSMMENSFIKYAGECKPRNNIPTWNGEWRLCGSSEKERLLRCKDSKFSLILGPLGPEDTPGPTTYRRLIESLKCGSIPIVLGLSRLPFDDVIDWRKAALIFPRTLWRDALQIAAAMDNDIMMEFRKQGKFLLNTYFRSPGLIFDSIVAIIRKKFLHPPPMALDFNPTILKKSGGTLAGIVKTKNVPFSTNTYQYRNYALNMGERIWNAPPGPHFVYPVSPFKPPSFHSQREARQLPLPNSIAALLRVVDEQLVKEISKMDRFSALKQFDDLLGKGNGTRLFQNGAALSKKALNTLTLSGSKSLSKRKSQSPRGGRYVYSKISEMFTIVTLTHHRDEQIAKLIESLEYCPFLHKIVIVWNNEYPIPAEMTLPDTHIPIEVSKYNVMAVLW